MKKIINDVGHMYAPAGKPAIDIFLMPIKILPFQSNATLGNTDLNQSFGNINHVRLKPRKGLKTDIAYRVNT